MFGKWLRGTGFVLLFGLAAIAPASADGPGSKFKPVENPDATFISPDGQLRVEQYFRDLGNEGYRHQSWIFDKDHRHGFLLGRGKGDDDSAAYQAGFRFSPDSQWLVRMQKLGAGYHTLFLYRRDDGRFSPAKPLGNMAWDYFFTSPDSKGMHRDPKDPYSMDHAQVHLTKGVEENYSGMGQHWPDSRYLVISLSFDTQGTHPPLPWIEDWHCVYDLKTGKFSVPPDFADHNAKAIKTAASEAEQPKRALSIWGD
jgi:hypothetical protein